MNFRLARFGAWLHIWYSFATDHTCGIGTRLLLLRTEESTSGDLVCLKKNIKLETHAYHKSLELSSSERFSILAIRTGRLDHEHIIYLAGILRPYPSVVWNWFMEKCFSLCDWLEQLTCFWTAFWICSSFHSHPVGARIAPRHWTSPKTSPLIKHQTNAQSHFGMARMCLYFSFLNSNTFAIIQLLKMQNLPKNTAVDIKFVRVNQTSKNHHGLASAQTKALLSRDLTHRTQLRGTYPS